VAADEIGVVPFGSHRGTEWPNAWRKTDRARLPKGSAAEPEKAVGREMAPPAAMPPRVSRGRFPSLMPRSMRSSAVVLVGFRQSAISSRSSVNVV
jgi:hypothetical protein